MRSLGLLTAAVATAALLAAPIYAGSSLTSSAAIAQQQVSSLRHGITWHRQMTWHYQALAGVARTRTDYAERRTTSVAFLGWMNHRWSHRQIAARRLARRRTTPVAGHWSLWNCIHNGAYPGAPHEGNSSSGTYTGPLQMTAGWDGFPVSNWYYVPIATVYADAEAAFRQHGYSTGWLEGQWPNTAPPCLKYA